ncbi:MAG: cysteine desulfurase family protein [Acidobacteriota bacterium]
MIYLDNNASTKMDPQVREEMNRASDLYGNPSSVHAEGRRARRAVEEAREEVGRLVGAAAGEVFFTSGGTEANAMAIHGATAGSGGPVVRSAVEHPSVREAADGTSRTRVAPVEPSGEMDPARFAAAVLPGTRLVTVMAANNEYGTIFPVAEISRRARAASPGVLVHTDAVQAAGRIPSDFGAWEVDLLSLSAHKMHGPKGVGALVVRRGVELATRTRGGGQEKGLRAGTENTAAIVGFGVAARLARERLEIEGPAIASLRDRLERGILATVSGTRLVGDRSPRLPNTSAIRFEGVSASTLLIRLDLEGVAVSTGSACSSGTLSASPAILALGLSRDEAGEVIRFSLSRSTTESEIHRTLSLLPAIVREIRGASTDGRVLEPAQAGWDAAR